jgi:hypothetical protein
MIADVNDPRDDEKQVHDVDTCPARTRASAAWCSARPGTSGRMGWLMSNWDCLMAATASLCLAAPGMTICCHCYKTFFFVADDEAK